MILSLGHWPQSAEARSLLLHSAKYISTRTAVPLYSIVGMVDGTDGDDTWCLLEGIPTYCRSMQYFVCAKKATEGDG